jgi:hypothetical protein
MKRPEDCARVTAIAWAKSLGVDRGMDRRPGKSQSHVCIRFRKPRRTEVEAQIELGKLLELAESRYANRAYAATPTARSS